MTSESALVTQVKVNQRVLSDCGSWQSERNEFTILDIKVMVVVLESIIVENSIQMNKKKLF